MKTTSLPLSVNLSKYNTGWVAYDTKQEIVAHAQSFNELTKKIDIEDENLTLLPASDDYFGIIT